MDPEDEKVTVVVTAVLPVVLLSLMTYVIMPQVTRVLRGWLYARPAKQDER